MIKRSCYSALIAKYLRTFPISPNIFRVVPDGKGQGQPAWQKEWKKCEEENE
jgi:hypothetical protein